ncbi:addiction module antidote protein, HigA family [Gracilibacillus orientalis]|uniref:Addiction module antidote protein, HigA family n=1 Tax=Gracilibacillus orientalis TaxID=334253 RepID=A0A1I4PKZ2_9BACI|nr:HigA family addiction module antitoxin [Gracilibacillus orientalis]SFM28501.1 addiction module antidote protein, HigA family [Gracilibacillus orientalis]
MSNEFIVPTGFVIKDYLDELEISQKDLAKRMGISEKHISNLLNGKSRLTEDFAIRLEKIIHSVPASYWLNYESKYREYKARNDLANEFDEATLKTFDKRFNFSKIFSGLDLDLKEQANEMLKLLRLSNFEQFDKVYSNLDVDFMEDGGEKEAIAIWLNLAREEVEIQNNDLTNKRYDKEKLEKSLSKFKKLALNTDYESSIKSARKLLNRLGIYLVFCDAVVNSKVRGALTSYKKHPSIFLSGRFKSHDHVWFALIHEIGHLLLHYIPEESLITLEHDLEFQEVSHKEKEANKFARDFFIHPDDYKDFVSTQEFDKKNIEQFAKSQDILPGIVVARLQHDGYLLYDQLNFLKQYNS